MNIFYKLNNRGGPHIHHKNFWYGHQSMFVRWVTLCLLLSMCVMESDWRAFCHCFSLMYIWITYQCCRTTVEQGVWLATRSLTIWYTLMTWSSVVHIQFLRICSQYGSDFNIKYNASKGNIIFVSSRQDSKMSFPNFRLSSAVLNFYNEVQNLGRYISDNLSDDRDIYRQCRMQFL